MDLGEIGWGVWSGFTWLRIEIVGGLLWMRWWTFGFWHHGVSWLVNASVKRNRNPRQRQSSEDYKMQTKIKGGILGKRRQSVYHLTIEVT
jgi:hypothetical protein